mgnify:CR=1 FL=1
MRTTIDLDDDLKARLSQVLPNRGFNRFVNEAVAEKLDAMERAQLALEMKEGYLATRQDRDELNEDWSVVDVESWPE